jgi:SAM-dependent methyltransferase
MSQTELEAQEYWNRTSDSETIQNYAHWFGTKKGSAKRFARYGQRHWEKFVKLVKAAKQKPTSYRRMVDWGCGGGINTVRFAEHFKVLAVDISAATLESCMKTCKEFGVEENVKPLLISCDKPYKVLLENRKFDFFISTACYQHFPSRRYGAHVTCLASLLLRFGGLALIQTRWNDGSAYYEPKEGKPYCHGKNAIRFTSYEIDEFSEVAKIAGFESLLPAELTRPNYAYYYLIKKGLPDGLHGQGIAGAPERR